MEITVYNLKSICQILLARQHVSSLEPGGEDHGDVLDFDCMTITHMGTAALCDSSCVRIEGSQVQDLPDNHVTPES